MVNTVLVTFEELAEMRAKLEATRAVLEKLRDTVRALSALDDLASDSSNPSQADLEIVCRVSHALEAALAAADEVLR